MKADKKFLVDIEGEVWYGQVEQAITKLNNINPSCRLSNSGRIFIIDLGEHSEVGVAPSATPTSTQSKL
ncbi:hypothetical protein [Nostoc sp.]|uniref:hypothetical protein n=1 Tax=Nostoc sp. TaxID=1180 RepID=UPI002FF5006C